MLKDDSKGQTGSQQTVNVLRQKPQENEAKDYLEYELLTCYTQRQLFTGHEMEMLKWTTHSGGL